jgi:hypothetical protein
LNLRIIKGDDNKESRQHDKHLSNVPCERAIMNLIGIAIALIGYCISILEYLNTPQFSVRLIILIILSTLALVLTIWNLQKQDREKLISSESGSISSSRDITYPCLTIGGSRIEDRKDPESLNIVEFTEGAGFGGVGFVFGENKRQKSDLLQNEDNKIIVWIDNGQLKVSTTIKDKDGKILARITGNDWDNAQKPLIYDRNFDKRGLEVVDAYCNVVLQVDMNKSCAKVSGVFYVESGKTIVANDKGFHFDVPGVKINPIFIYPSENHLGERIKKPKK